MIIWANQLIGSYTNFVFACICIFISLDLSKFEDSIQEKNSLSEGNILWMIQFRLKGVANQWGHEIRALFQPCYLCWVEQLATKFCVCVQKVWRRKKNLVCAKRGKNNAKRNKKETKKTQIEIKRWCDQWINTLQYPHTYPKYCPQCLNIYIYIEKWRRKGKGTSCPVGDLTSDLGKHWANHWADRYLSRCWGRKWSTSRSNKCSILCIRSSILLRRASTVWLGASSSGGWGASCWGLLEVYLLVLALFPALRHHCRRGWVSAALVSSTWTVRRWPSS